MAGRRKDGKGTPARTPAKRAKVTPSRNGADAVAAQLEALGVEVVFGIPGVHNLAIFDALDRTSIRTVLVRHEQTCVYAADGYARATGRLGVAVTTTGPGAANTIGAMGEARASRVPILQISTQSERAILEGRSGRFSLHESPHQRQMLVPVCLWSGSVERADAIPTMLQRAAREAFVGRRGPVFLEIPHDLLSEEVAWDPQSPLVDRTFPPEPFMIQRAADVLGAAKRPIIWAGGGAISSGAGDAVAKLAEVIDAPIVTSFAGKGLVPPDHPLYVGFPAHQPEVTAMIKGSDAAFIVGSDLDGMNTQGWRLPFPRPRVAINTVAEDARRNYACDVIVECDAREGIDALLAVLAPRGKSSAVDRVKEVRAAAEKAIRADKELAAPYRFVKAVSDGSPEQVMVFADMAVAGYWLAGYHRARAPRSFAYPVGWGTLGYALPAAVGAATTGRKTLVVCGDAGLMYGVGELATLVQERSPLVVLVVNDSGYGMLRFDAEARYGRTFATELKTPDFVALAGAFGMPSRKTTQRELAATLRWAFEQRGPALVELRARFAPPLTTSPRWPLRGKPEARP